MSSTETAMKERDPKLFKLVDSWNWNCGSVEIAVQAKEYGLTAEETRDAMIEYGFPENQAVQTLDVYEGLEAMGFI